MSKFGWSYPPGAANDPLAPYNQDFDDTNCAYCGAELPDDVTGFSDADEDAIDEGYCNAKCLKDWEDNECYPSEDYGKPHLTDKQKEDIKDIRNIICEYNRIQANKKYSDRDVYGFSKWLDEYYIGWAEYWIDAAITGNDPCEQAMFSTPAIWADYCITAAKENAKYIERRLP